MMIKPVETGPFSLSDAVMSNYAPTAEPAALLERIVHRLDAIGNIIGESNTNLSDVRLRTFGPWAENGECGKGSDTLDHCQQTRLLYALDQLESAARSSLSHAVALNVSL